MRPPSVLRRTLSRIGNRVLDRREAPPEADGPERLDTPDDVTRRSIEYGARQSDFGAQTDELLQDIRKEG